MRTKTDTLDKLIFMVLEFQKKRLKPVTRIFLSESTYDHLMAELQKEDLDTIYGAELKITKRNSKILLT